MNIFVVTLKNQPGEGASMLEALARAGINVLLTAVTTGDQGTVVFVGDNEPGARTALEAGGFSYEEKPALMLRTENQPGAGARFCRQLADAGVNIEVLLPVEISSEIGVVVLAVDDVEKAEAALGDALIRE